MAGFTGLRWKIAVKNEKVEREEKEKKIPQTLVLTGWNTIS